LISIAIDGPAGAGKTTVAKALAEKLGFFRFDSGALYRAVAYFFLKNSLDFSKEHVVSKNICDINIDFGFENGIQRMFLVNKNNNSDEILRIDITEEIRAEQVSAAASVISAFACVRKFLLKTQRGIAAENNVIMDGRDIGTAVLPKANMKIFLTASLEERAKRRFNQIKDSGKEADFETVLKKIEERDFADSNRKNCPLRIAKDAIIYNSTEFDFETVVENLTKIISKLIF
jgi:cytidylate kinase